MKEREYKSSKFLCHRIDGNVTIDYEILVHRSSATGNVDKRFVTSIDCDQKKSCGVGVVSGRSISYDWSKCVHPELKKLA
jgi:hypothetical protein